MTDNTNTRPAVASITEADIQDGKTMAILAYIFFIIPLLAARDKKFAMYHTEQAIILWIAFIIIYIAWSFKKIPPPYSPWKFGISAVLALIHDAFVVLGIFSLFGHFYHVEIDSLFVTAILTVIGFSVHDTIVVFDRIRENLPKMPKSSFEEIVDFSLTETLVRSLNTSLTVTLTLTSLLLFGGEPIRWFVVALLIGVVSGTYSSIFNAAPLLVVWEKNREPKRK